MAHKAVRAEPLKPTEMESVVYTVNDCVHLGVFLCSFLVFL